jgi:hypothetical protein
LNPNAVALMLFGTSPLAPTLFGLAGRAVVAVIVVVVMPPATRQAKPEADDQHSH